MDGSSGKEIWRKEEWQERRGWKEEVKRVVSRHHLEEAIYEKVRSKVEEDAEEEEDAKSSGSVNAVRFSRRRQVGRCARGIRANGQQRKQISADKQHAECA